MSYRSGLALLVVLSAAPAAAQPTAPGDATPSSLAISIRHEVARAAQEASGRVPGGSAQAIHPRRNWFRRHPVLTGALVGAGTGFLIGYLPGDDGVFYDFTAEFNGTVLAGVGAGAGAASVAIVQAIRR
jgi:hypothetical protein